MHDKIMSLEIFIRTFYSSLFVDKMAANASLPQKQALLNYSKRKHYESMTKIDT